MTPESQPQPKISESARQAVNILQLTMQSFTYAERLFIADRLKEQTISEMEEISETLNKQKNEIAAMLHHAR